MNPLDFFSFDEPSGAIRQQKARLENALKPSKRRCSRRRHSGNTKSTQKAARRAARLRSQ